MSSTTRSSRRRRLLQEGIAAHASTEGSSTVESDRGTQARYAPRPGSVSFVLASSLPRSIAGLSGLVGLLLLPVAIIATLGILTHHPPAGFGQFSGGEFLLPEARLSLATWWTSAGWLLMAGLSLMIYGLRSRRMDDLRGGYRWWIVATACCVAMSVNATVHLHALIANQIGGLVGWSPLAADALWWLVPGVLIMGGLSIRLFLDLLESPLAAAAVVIAWAALGYSWFVEAGLSPAPIVSWASPAALVVFASLLGQSLLLLSLVCYARRIVLEAEGAIAPPLKSAEPTSKQNKKKSAQTTAERKEKTQRTVAAKPAETQQVEPEQKATRTKRQTRHEQVAEQPTQASSETVWTDGADGDYQDDYDDQPKRKLTKAERKRLRKQKARRAA